MRTTTLSERPKCDICRLFGGTIEPAYADAYIPGHRQWGYVCKDHFDKYRCRLGMGKGQQILVESEVLSSRDWPSQRPLKVYTIVFVNSRGEKDSVLVAQHFNMYGHSVDTPHRRVFEEQDGTLWRVWDRHDSEGRRMVQKGPDWVGGLDRIKSH